MWLLCSVSGSYLAIKTSASETVQGEPMDAVWEANIMGDDNGRRFDSPITCCCHIRLVIIDTV